MQTTLDRTTQTERYVQQSPTPIMQGPLQESGYITAGLGHDGQGDDVHRNTFQ